MTGRFEDRGEDLSEYVSVAGADEFRSRLSPRARRELSPAQKLWRDATQAAVELNAQGFAPTLELIKNKLRQRWSVQSLTELLGTEKWAQAMEARGVPWNAETGTLSPKQISFLAMFFDTSKQVSHAQILRAAGVTGDQFRGWMRQPVFAAQMEQFRQQMLADGLSIATQRLVEKADKGDIQAIDRVMAFNGADFRTLTGEDVAALLGLVYQILDEEKVPVSVTRRIAAAVMGSPSGVAATMTAQTTLTLPETP